MDEVTTIEADIEDMLKDIGTNIEFPLKEATSLKEWYGIVSEIASQLAKEI